MITRRSLLLAGLLGAAGCATSGYGGPPRDLVIAAGERGGLYFAFAELLAAQITGAEPKLRATALETTGSVANAALLASGQAQLAMMLADTAQTATDGKAPFTSALPLAALGRVYENYLQLVVRADGPVHALPDLTGRVVSLGATGSGAALVGDRVLAAAGLDRALVLEHRTLRAATDGVAQGQLDALLWSGGVPTPALADLDATVGIRLLPLDAVLATLRDRYGPVYDRVLVPPGAYRTVRDVPTIGVANLLTCRADLPTDIAAVITAVLVERAARLVPDQAVGAQYMDIRALISTAGIPLHPGAATAYRRLHG
jgi:TRAP transporter TAXI family solute receptor